MKKFILFNCFLMFLLFILIGCGEATNPVEAQLVENEESGSFAKVTTIFKGSFTIPFPPPPGTPGIPNPFFIPCAYGGLGEDVLISGNVRVAVNVFIDANGGFHVTDRAGPQGGTAVGQTTGDIYRTAGGEHTSIHESFTGLPFSFNRVINSSFIGPGPGNNFSIRIRLHTTINANGDVTVDFLNINEECK
jgi:hypothetical protein